MPEVRFLDLEGGVEPGVRSRGDRDADYQAFRGTSDWIPQSRGKTFCRSSATHPRVSRGVRLWSGGRRRRGKSRFHGLDTARPMSEMWRAGVRAAHGLRLREQCRRETHLRLSLGTRYPPTTDS